MNTTQIICMFFLGAMVVGFGMATVILCFKLRDARDREDKLVENLQDLRQGLLNGTRRALLSVFGPKYLVNYQHSKATECYFLVVEEASSRKQRLRIGFDWRNNALDSILMSSGGAIYTIQIENLDRLIELVEMALAASAASQ